MLKLLSSKQPFNPFVQDVSAVMLEIIREDQKFNSSSVAISDNILLTAAHSVDGMDSGLACIGDRLIKIDKVIIHPSYNPSKSFYENDIAIVYLSENLPFNVLPAILGQDLIDSPGHYMRVGFGRREGENRKYSFSPSFIERSFNKTSLCFTDTNALVGDSGGPIYKMSAKGLFLVALHSTLEGTSKIFTVNIDHFKDWILGHIAQEQVS